MNKKLKILMLGPNLQTTSGISNVINNWIENGIKNEIDLTYIQTLNNYVPGHYFEKFYDALKSYLAVFIKSFSEVNVAHIHMSSHMSFFRKWFIIKFLQSRGIKTVIHLHGSRFEDFYNTSNPMIKSMIQKTFNKIDAVFVLSKSWEKFIASISDNKHIYILYNGANLNKFSKIPDSDSKVNISFMGRLGERKGTYDLLDAFTRIAPDIPHAHLILGGDGDVEKIRKLVKERRLENQVSVLGWVSGDDKNRVFNESSIYVLPSYNEGLPGSILEAMAAGNPIISTPVGGIPEAVEENVNGFLVKPGDINTLAEKLKILSNDRKKRLQMGLESKRILEEKFEMSIINKSLVNLLNKVVQI